MYVAGTISLSANSPIANESKLDSVEKAWEMTLNEVVVTGTRTPKLLKDSPVLTRVISASDIKKSDATNISDLLQTELPGIEFSYAMNQQVSLNMQGFGGNSILFLVDGERIAGETLDNVDFSRLNLNDAGKVEIVKGAASSLYGSNAVGGVINIISRESPGRGIWMSTLATARIMSSAMASTSHSKPANSPIHCRGNIRILIPTI